MWEEEREFEIFDEFEEYNPEYDNTDCFSYLDLSSSAEEDFEYEESEDSNYDEDN